MAAASWAGRGGHCGDPLLYLALVVGQARGQFDGGRGAPAAQGVRPLRPCRWQLHKHRRRRAAPHLPVAKGERVLPIVVRLRDWPVTLKAIASEREASGAVEAEVRGRRHVGTTALAEEDRPAAEAPLPVGAAVVVEAYTFGEAVADLLALRAPARANVAAHVNQCLGLPARQEPLLVLLPARIQAIAMPNELVSRWLRRCRSRPSRAGQAAAALQSAEGAMAPKGRAFVVEGRGGGGGGFFGGGESVLSDRGREGAREDRRAKARGPAQRHGYGARQEN
mmetsp:Transcript_128613/g.251895  ORF Transcript_128613/g.251895 Transcript_128613/m.251895 type:complete len:280 (-) Transcript_128613:19-858(-)